MPGRRGSKRKLDEKEQKRYAAKKAIIVPANYAANTISEVLSLMRQTETAVCRAADRLGCNQSRLEDNQAEHSQLMERVRALELEAKQLTKEIAADKVTVKTGGKQLTNLRFWGESYVWKDLPHELLSMVFQYLGYVHQQRLVRVSRVWKDLITSLTHIYCDAGSLIDARFSGKGIRTLTVCKTRRAVEMELSRTLPTKTGEHDWKFRCQSVRHFTVDGMNLVDAFYHLVRYGVAMAKRFPDLVALNFTRMEVSRIGLVHDVEFFIRQHPTVRVTISQAMVSVLPLYVADSPDRQKILASRLHSYRAISDFTIPVEAPCDGLRAFLNGLIWPYPDQQISWLVRYAPYLNDRVMTIYRDATWSALPIPCLDCRKEFCKHRDVAFYKKTLSAPERILLAIFILQMRIPGMESPPVPFQFEQLRFIKGRYQLVPEV